MPELPEHDALLPAVLDRLIPAEGPWPGGGAPGFPAAVVADAGKDGEAALLEDLLRALPTGFDTLAANAQDKALRTVEAAQPAAFAALHRHLVNVYYSHPQVLAVLEAQTGYPARPPLFGGYEMTPFDPDRLAAQRQRKPLWRPVSPDTAQYPESSDSRIA